MANNSRVKRKLAAIVFTDIVGFSELSAERDLKNQIKFHRNHIGMES